MPAKFKKLIQDYCVERAIEVPPGFARGSASQYAIIRLLPTPKLVARTWFAVADVLNYIEQYVVPEYGDSTSAAIRILDFKTGEELIYTGSKRLDRLRTFMEASAS